jgi:rubrerythrin
MPNPSILHTLIEDRFEIARGWRVLVRFEKGDGYRAQLERLSNGHWQVCGPCARSSRSAPCALQRLADGYRGFGNAIEQQLSFAPNTRIAEGCPRCRYSHISLKARGDEITSHCPACGEQACRPAFDPG